MRKINRILRTAREFIIAIILFVVTAGIIWRCAAVEPQAVLGVTKALLIVSIIYFLVAGLLFLYGDSIVKLLVNGLSPTVAVIVCSAVYDFSMGLEYLTITLNFAFGILLLVGIVVAVEKVSSWYENDDYASYGYRHIPYLIAIDIKEKKVMSYKRYKALTFVLFNRSPEATEIRNRISKSFDRSQTITDPYKKVIMKMNSKQIEAIYNTYRLELKKDKTVELMEKFHTKGEPKREEIYNERIKQYEKRVVEAAAASFKN